MTMNTSTSTGDHYILLVESDPDLRSLLVELIKEEVSCQIAVASDAYQAIILVERSKPALLVLGQEIVLPRSSWRGSISIEEYCRKLRSISGIDLYYLLNQDKDGENIPAILVTDFRDDRSAAKRHGIAHCEQGFDIDRLAQLIKENLKLAVSFTGSMAA